MAKLIGLIKVEIDITSELPEDDGRDWLFAFHENLKEHILELKYEEFPKYTSLNSSIEITKTETA